MAELNSNTYFIDHMKGNKNVYGFLSGTCLLGKETVTFSNDKLSIINITAKHLFLLLIFK